jgi:hypothetical protein
MKKLRHAVEMVFVWSTLTVMGWGFLVVVTTWVFKAVGGE